MPEGPLPAPPLVRGTAFSGNGARHRLRGPSLGQLKEELAASLRPAQTTVSDDGVVRFGDALLLLSHGTEVVLQADISREVRVVDDSHSQRREFAAFLLTTGRVLHPCARNTFSVARADGDDEFRESLEVHYGQRVRLLASSFLCDRLLHLHLEDPPSAGLARSSPVLLPRAAKRTCWRVLPAPTAAGLQPPEPLGRAVRVNELVALENVETGRLLMSATAGLVATGFGTECGVFAADLGAHGEDRVKEATWSFVNDKWVEAVNEAENQRTGGVSWKEDEGDDFRGGALPPPSEEEDAQGLAAFRRPEAQERKRLEELYVRLARDPKTEACSRRIWPLIRGHGLHGARKFRRNCSSADVQRSGVLPARTFEGILVNMGVRLQPQEWEDFCEVFGGGPPETVDYDLFFGFMGGVMPDYRLETLKRAYRKLRRTSRGAVVTAEVIMRTWNTQCYPGVRSGSISDQEAYRDFASQWEVSSHDGYVSPEDFLEYYRDVSMFYTDGSEFVEMVKTAWDL